MFHKLHWKREWKKRIRKITMSRSGRRFKRLNKVRVVRALAALALVSVIGGSLVLSILFAWYAKDLPRPDRVVRREGFATKILDRNGKQLWDIFAEQRRIPVSFDEIPIHLQQAVIAIEDKDFYEHEGFDPRGILRAAKNIIIFHRLQGGSTLTQQLVKNVLLSPERTLPRKIKEFILAVQIERKFSKDEILAMYLNEAPFGGTAWGVQAAAELYFEKDVSELTLIESVILAGLPQRPTAYSPFGTNPDAYKERSTEVLRRMREDKYITRDQEKLALEELEKIKFSAGDTSIKAPHFVMYVREQLSDLFGDRMVEQGGLTVTTTLDLDLQEEAQKVVSEEISKVETIDITNGAAVVMNPKSGEILSMVGSKDFFAQDYDGQVNVTLSLRQPGSAIKPVTYATAFKQGYTPASLIMDVRTEFPGKTASQPYIPVNYDGEYHGPMSMRTALGSSINMPAVKILQLVGVEEMLTLAHDMGFSTLAPTEQNKSRLGLSVTLGGGEVRLLDMVSAYSVFSNGGNSVEPVSILEVKDSKGKTLMEHKETGGRRVLAENVAFLVNNVLSDNSARLVTFSPNSLINIAGRNIAVKTGTTNDQRDNWTVGWTNGTAVVGVWVGNNDNSPMKRVASGVSGAAPIWRRIMLEVLSSLDDLPFKAPGDIEKHKVDAISGYLEHDGFPAREDYFIRGTIPAGNDPIHAKLKVCKSSEKLATQAQIANGDYDEKEYFVFIAPQVLASLTRDAWQRGIDEWISTQGDSRYRPPTELCEGGEELVVRVLKPTNESVLDTNEVEMQVEVFSDSSVEWVQIIVDGNVKDTLTSKPFKTTMYLDDGRYRLRFKARNSSGKVTESGELKIGVNMSWAEPTPTSAPTATPTIEPTPSPTPTP